jgi:hypothetical protein
VCFGAIALLLPFCPSIAFLQWLSGLRSKKENHSEGQHRH